MLVTVLAACSLMLAQVSLEPPGFAGVFYKAKDGWQKMDLATPLNVSTGAFSGATLSYKGAESSVRIADRRPTFYYNRIPTARNAVIIVFEKKKDHRDLKVIRVNALLTAKGGPDKKHLVDVSAESINDHLVSVTPVQDLPLGEYLLTDSGGYTGYDFEITDTPTAGISSTPAGIAKGSDHPSAQGLLLRVINASFAKEGVTGYGEISGDKLIIHSERASAMRFHATLANERLMSMMQEANIATYVYTNDSDQNFVYDVKAGKIVSPADSQPTGVK